MIKPRTPKDVADKERARYKSAKDAGLKTVLFVCTGNSIRSQIAEGLVNHLFKEKWAAFSAGVMPMTVPKDLMKVMREVGIDMSQQKAKHIDIFKDCRFDRVIVLCSDAGRICPTLPDCAEQEHIFFHDPVSSVFLSEGFCIGLASKFRHLREEMKEVFIRQFKDA